MDGFHLEERHTRGLNDEGRFLFNFTFTFFRSFVRKDGNKKKKKAERKAERGSRFNPLYSAWQTRIEYLSK